MEESVGGEGIIAYSVEEFQYLKKFNEPMKFFKNRDKVAVKILMNQNIGFSSSMAKKKNSMNLNGLKGVF